jgi:hypothetical protein
MSARRGKATLAGSALSVEQTPMSQTNGLLIHPNNLPLSKQTLDELRSEIFPPEPEKVPTAITPATKEPKRVTTVVGNFVMPPKPHLATAKDMDEASKDASRRIHPSMAHSTKYAQKSKKGFTDALDALLAKPSVVKLLTKPNAPTIMPASATAKRTAARLLQRNEISAAEHQRRRVVVMPPTYATPLDELNDLRRAYMEPQMKDYERDERLRNLLWFLAARGLVLEPARGTDELDREGADLSGQNIEGGSIGGEFKSTPGKTFQHKPLHGFDRRLHTSKADPDESEGQTDAGMPEHDDYGSGEAEN